MIDPNEYNMLLNNVRLSICTYTDKYNNKIDYGINSHKSKIKLILVNQYFSFMEKSNINPINETNEILPHVGQLRVSDGEGQYYAEKEYSEEDILKSLKRINQILRTGYTISIYDDVYNKTN